MGRRDGRPVVTGQPRADDDPLVEEVRQIVRLGGPIEDPEGAMRDVLRKLLVVIDGTRASLAVVTARADEAEARVADLEALLEERAASHLADLERVEERCNREGAVHRHEAQAATADAIEARGQLRTARERIGQLEAELAAQQGQTCALARSATRAERVAAGLELVADGWRRIAEARA